MSRAAVWMALAALAWTVLGCGGGDDANGEGEGSTRELEQLVSALKDVTNSPSRASIDMGIEGAPESFSMTVRMESLRGQARLEVDFEQGGEAIAMEIIQHDAAAWMRSPSLQSLLPAGKTWIRTTDPEVVGGSTLTPAQFGDLIEDAGRVEDLGRERVDGNAPRHLRTVADVSDLAAKAGRPSAGGQIRMDMDEFEYDVPVDTAAPPAYTVTDDSVLE
jgi:hypothetical protein